MSRPAKASARLAIAWRTVGLLSAATMAPFCCSMIGRGVPAGARKPTQLMKFIPGSPASDRVGISGTAAERLSLVTASARTRLARTSGSSEEKSEMATWMLPATSAAASSGAVLKGT